MNPTSCIETCGDGLDFYFYECDDGNTTPGDGCDATCVIEVGFTCTGGNPTTADTCGGVCGNGIMEVTEVCDDFNTVGGDGCSADCLTLEPEFLCVVVPDPTVCTEVCGDGIIVGDTCDDGNTSDLDGCSADC